ncbi:hypothetical protein L202_04817 [Cryptococcus amylolentus CBS 6039]|uniref:Uncharacterized protein n=1 Tax=Cryptococcus amylolentus CBS 6039 TaxID=1295533 RepID=A0A1E3HPN3_9TREE|nr:hypothetical protein L202_04817 [Cryptococcus amylolentus CBS 6039]ODN77666.1 hypothetical protein L202_04817 [Cryptococcus amylolentus CBS 6039]
MAPITLAPTPLPFPGELLVLILDYYINSSTPADLLPLILCNRHFYRTYIKDLYKSVKLDQKNAAKFFEGVSQRTVASGADAPQWQNGESETRSKNCSLPTPISSDQSSIIVDQPSNANARPSSVSYTSLPVETSAPFALTHKTHLIDTCRSVYFRDATALEKFYEAEFQWASQLKANKDALPQELSPNRLLNRERIHIVFGTQCVRGFLADVEGWRAKIVKQGYLWNTKGAQLCLHLPFELSSHEVSQLWKLPNLVNKMFSETYPLALTIHNARPDLKAWVDSGNGGRTVIMDLAPEVRRGAVEGLGDGEKHARDILDFYTRFIDEYKYVLCGRHSSNYAHIPSLKFTNFGTTYHPKTDTLSSPSADKSDFMRKNLKNEHKHLANELQQAEEWYNPDPLAVYSSFNESANAEGEEGARSRGFVDEFRLSVRGASLPVRCGDYCSGIKRESYQECC